MLWQASTLALRLLSWRVRICAPKPPAVSLPLPFPITSPWDTLLSSGSKSITSDDEASDLAWIAAERLVFGGGAELELIPGETTLLPIEILTFPLSASTFCASFLTGVGFPQMSSFDGRYWQEGSRILDERRDPSSAVEVNFSLTPSFGKWEVMVVRLPLKRAPSPSGIFLLLPTFIPFWAEPNMTCKGF
jgi:hypothetical protein